MSQRLYRSSILAVPEDMSRPLWSVMIPTYNCADYLRETLASVLAQDPGPEVMQIEIIDDHSTKDDPAAVVEELGQGRVQFYRQPQNVGHVKNFQTCLERSRGRLVHLLHGDDCVRVGFYQKLQHAFETHPEIGAAFCRHIHMDEEGHWHHISCLEQSESGILENWLERIAVQQRIQTPSIVVRRSVYEKLGGFDSRIRYWGEDWEMWVRIAAQYPVWYEAEPLALYRTRAVSLSGRSLRTGENIQDFRTAISIVKDYLPSESADKLSKTALENYAFYAINSAREFINHGDATAASNQLREALRCSTSLRVFRDALKLFRHVAFQKVISSFQPLQPSRNAN
jgi:glycosyltransferase involved in cell wall biosynthesis